VNEIKRKISVITGTRAEYGLLRPILHEITKNSNLELYLIVTGMHLSKKHGYTINEIKNDGFKIYKKFPMIPKGNSSFYMAQSLGLGILEFSKIFKKLQPDINLILGDRDEAFASALAAFHMNIPNAHIHGGDKTKAGIDEYIRHAITKISNIHFVATKKSKNRILRMGENPKYVLLTGSPGIDEIKKHKITNKIKLEEKYQMKLNGDEILLVFHPVTTQTKFIKKQIENILKALIRFNKPIIIIKPNSDSGSNIILKKLDFYKNKYSFVKIFSNLPRQDYLGFLKTCKILVGNSSSGMIEATYFKIPVVNIGIRQSGRETSKNVIHVNDLSELKIHNAVQKGFKITKKNLHISNQLYGQGNASKKIVNFLENVTINDQLIQKQIED